MRSGGCDDDDGGSRSFLKGVKVKFKVHVFRCRLRRGGSGLFGLICRVSCCTFFIS